MPRDAQELPDTVATARQIVKGLQRHLRDVAEVLARLEELLDQHDSQPTHSRNGGTANGNKNTHHRDPVRA